MEKRRRKRKITKMEKEREGRKEEEGQMKVEKAGGRGERRRKK